MLGAVSGAVTAGGDWVGMGGLLAGLGSLPWSRAPGFGTGGADRLMGLGGGCGSAGAGGARTSRSAGRRRAEFSPRAGRGWRGEIVSLRAHPL